MPVDVLPRLFCMENILWKNTPFSLRYPTGTLWIASYVSPIFHLQSLSKEDGFSNYSLLLLFSSLASRKKISLVRNK